MESQVWGRLAFFQVTSSIWVKGVRRGTEACCIIASGTIIAPGLALLQIFVLLVNYF